MKQNKIVKATLGPQIQFMSCNGKIHPWANKTNFDVVVYGTIQKGKVSVECTFNKANQ